jgi:tRNA pseudouridine(38-40) synthase
MLKNFKIIIEYDGTAYHGWQRQADDPTIQGEIEKALMAKSQIFTATQNWIPVFFKKA